MSTTAMIGSGQPTLRRVASSSTTIMTVPMIQSMRLGVADTELKVVEDVGHVEAGHDGGDRAKPVDDADPERRQKAGFGRRRVVFLAPGEDEKDQAKDAGDVNAAMQGLLQQPEAGRVVVKTGQAEQQDRDDPARHGKQRPESHLRIEFGLEPLDLGVVEVRGCRHAESANRAMSPARQSVCHVQVERHAAISGCPASL